MRPVRFARVTNKFAAPGSYASEADSHGPKGHHTGIDFGDRVLPSFRAIDNLPVRSSLAGEVVRSEYNSWAGNFVAVYSAAEDITISYWHMTGRKVQLGQYVDQGQVLGNVGTTGNSRGVHLHVQVNRGRGFNYHGHIDPRPWCGGMKDWWPGFLAARRAARRAARKAARRP